MKITDSARTQPRGRLLYAIPDAAEQLSVSARVVERLIAEGEIETVKIGRRRLVPDEALEDFVAQLRQGR